MPREFDVTVRPLGSSEPDVLWEVLYHAIHVAPGAEAPAPDVVRAPELSRYVEGWGRAGDVAVVAALPDGSIIGAAWVRLMAGEGRGYGFVDERTSELSIAVLPEHRGRGVGTRLLEALLRRLTGEFEAISLSVSTTNPAVRLYERLGFQTVARTGDSLTMLKLL